MGRYTLFSSPLYSWDTDSHRVYSNRSLQNNLFRKVYLLEDNNIVFKFPTNLHNIPEVEKYKSIFMRKISPTCDIKDVFPCMTSEFPTPGDLWKCLWPRSRQSKHCGGLRDELKNISREAMRTKPHI